MSIIRPASARQISIGLTILRIIAGFTVCMHGYQKLFVYGFGGVTGAFTQMGIPLPGLTGPAIGLLEFFGGIALIIGLFTRPLAALLALDLLGAILFVRMKGGFFSPNGMELEFVLFGAFAALAFAGAGSYSADQAIARRTGRAVP